MHRRYSWRHSCHTTKSCLARNEYLAAANRILKAQLSGGLKFSDAERATLGEIGHRLGRKTPAEIATVAKPDSARPRRRLHRRAGRAGRRGPTALLVADAAAALIGRALDATALAGLDQAARRACKPIDDKRTPMLAYTAPSTV